MVKFNLSLKVVILNDAGQCLLLRRSPDSRSNPGKWEFPGGKSEPGESFDEALLREVIEETGLTISLTGVAGACESELPDRKIAYLILEGHLESGEVSLSGEHDEHAWVAVQDLPGKDLAEQFKVFAEIYSRTHSQ